MPIIGSVRMSYIRGLVIVPGCLGSLIRRGSAPSAESPSVDGGHSALAVIRFESSGPKHLKPLYSSPHCILKVSIAAVLADLSAAQIALSPVVDGRVKGTNCVTADYYHGVRTALHPT